MVKFGITNLSYACYMWCILSHTNSSVTNVCMLVRVYVHTYFCCYGLYTNLRRLKLIIYHISWQLKHYFYIKTTHCLIYYTDSTQLFWQDTLTIFHNTSKLCYFQRAYFFFVIWLYVLFFFGEIIFSDLGLINSYCFITFC